MNAGRTYEYLILGAISFVILVLCFLLVFAGIRFTILWCRQHPLRKPPCQHELVVCDYKSIFDYHNMTTKDEYLAACTKCGITNWVEKDYLYGMAQLGLYKKEDNHNG